MSGDCVGCEVVGSLLGIIVGVLVIGALLGEGVGWNVGCVVTGFDVGSKVGLALGSAVGMELGSLVGSGWNIECKTYNQQNTMMANQKNNFLCALKTKLVWFWKILLASSLENMLVLIQ